MKKLNLLPVFLLLILSCNRDEDIKKVKLWKYSEGAMFSDVLSLGNKDFHIKNDTIFKLNVPIYKIVSHQQRFLAGDQVLQIKDLKTGDTARYVSK